MYGTELFVVSGGPKGKDGAIGHDGASAFESWLVEQGITDTPETHDANWQAYMDAITGEPGPTGVSAYEEYKATHPSASYEDWLRVVTASYSVPIIEAFRDGPAVRIPRIHPESKKPVYRKLCTIGKIDQLPFDGNGQYILDATALTALIPDYPDREKIWVNNGESYMTPPDDEAYPEARLPMTHNNYTVSAFCMDGDRFVLTHNVGWVPPATVVVCFEYTLTADQPIEFPIWTQKEGWISPPGYIGEIVTTFDTDPAPGTLVCDGSLLERLDFPSLYDFLQLKIPTLIVDADTFNLPDLRGEFLRGFDGGRGVDAGRVFGSAQGDAIRNITGSIPGMAYWNYIPAGDPTGVLSYTVLNITNNLPNQGPNADWAQYYGFSFNASLAVPTATENRPRNVAITYCIRYMNTFTGIPATGTE